MNLNTMLTPNSDLGEIDLRSFQLLHQWSGRACSHCRLSGLCLRTQSTLQAESERKSSPTLLLVDLSAVLAAAHEFCPFGQNLTASAADAVVSEPCAHFGLLKTL